MEMITTSGLTKTYGSRTVVDGLDLHVPAGSVYGFLGPNGSGKSTTMKMLLSLVRPTSGEIVIGGEPMDRRTRAAQLARIGSLIEAPSCYTHLTGRENLRVMCRMLDLPATRVDEVLEIVHLREHAERRVAHYSLGMKQRLGIGMALDRHPRLLILDEPTNGLDPGGIEEIRRLVISLGQQGTTVMVSSHLLDEIEKMSTVLGIVARGRMLFQGTRDELFARSVPELVIDTPQVELASELTSRLDPKPLPTGVRLGAVDLASTPEVVRTLVGAGVPITGVRREQQSLEDVFMDLTGGEGL